MPLIHRLSQRMGDAGPNPDHRGLFYAEFHRDRVSCLKADAANIPGEAVRVLRHDLYGVRAVGLVDAHCPRRTNAMVVKEDHDFTNDLLLGPRSGYAAGSYRTYARYLAQALRLSFDRIKDLLAESAHEFLGVDRSDPPNHSGTEVFFDTIEGSRFGRFQKLCPVLLAVGAVVGPFAGCGDPFAGRDHRGVPDHRDKIATTTRFDPQYAEAVVSIVIGDALDETRQHFLRGCLRLRFHVERRIIESAGVRTEIITQPRNGTAREIEKEGSRSAKSWVRPVSI